MNCSPSSWESAMRLREKGVSGRGEFKAGFVAIKKFDAKLIFQIMQRPAHRRLGNSQPGRSAANVQLFGRGHEVAQVPEFHCQPAITGKHRRAKNKALGSHRRRDESESMKTTTLHIPG